MDSTEKGSLETVQDNAEENCLTIPGCDLFRRIWRIRERKYAPYAVIPVRHSILTDIFNVLTAGGFIYPSIINPIRRVRERDMKLTTMILRTADIRNLSNR